MSVSFEETYQLRVLVVERDPLAASLHAAYIEAIEGFTACGTASTRRQTLALAALRRPDLVLLDLSIDGPTSLIRRLRPLPVIGVTSVYGVHGAIELRPLLRSFLFKPFLLETLSDALERCAPIRLRR